jgi:hypothetical protein
MSDFQYDEDVGRATGAGEVHEDFLSNLSRISQLTGKSLPGDCSDVFLIALTGFSDPIYAEAYVKIHGFDIMLGLSYYSTSSSRIIYQTIYRCFIGQPNLQYLAKPLRGFRNAWGPKNR